MKTIVVDDETNALHVFLDSVMWDLKREYRFFKDDKEAILSYVKENDVDGAFLDIGMPRINGIDLAKELLKIKPNMKIAFVTGMSKSMEDLPEDIRPSVVGFIYKPINQNDFEKVAALLESRKQILEVRTFGTFDCFLNGRLVHFSSAKSKELFALLIVYEGKTVTMDQAIAALWPDKDRDKAKILYRDAVWRLRQTLNEIGYPCVEFGRAVLSADVSDIDCDYYDLINGKGMPYGGEFLPSYDWSMEYQSIIDYVKK